ncbi:MAG: hypothetical protein ACD_46C00269G0002 [uncultured bacterium]|nr:MAG: hypothetical protein ACD_46C00269G0002 [uncultured bacterium]
MKKIIFILLCVLQTVCFATPPTTKKLTVILDWFPNPDHAPLIVAKEKGFFKEQGLEVELIGPADPSDPPKLVAAQKADIGITYQPEFMQQVDQGLPLVRIGTLIDKPLDCLVTLKQSNIQKISDLKGKKIAAGSGTSNLMLKVLLQKAGLKENDVELINVKYNLTQALLSKKVDAVSGMMRNVEIPELDAKGKKVNTFFPEENGIPNYSVLIMITNTKNIHDPRLPKFLAAVQKAVAFLDTQPEAGWKMFAKAYPEANNAVNRESWFATLPYFAEDPASFDTTEWKSFAQFMHENEMIKTVQPISKYAVTLG